MCHRWSHKFLEINSALESNFSLLFVPQSRAPGTRGILEHPHRGPPRPPLQGLLLLLRRRLPRRLRQARGVQQQQQQQQPGGTLSGGQDLRRQRRRGDDGAGILDICSRRLRELLLYQVELKRLRKRFSARKPTKPI